MKPIALSGCDFATAPCAGTALARIVSLSNFRTWWLYSHTVGWYVVAVWLLHGLH